jgi:hypothetical protein
MALGATNGVMCELSTTQLWFELLLRILAYDVTGDGIHAVAAALATDPGIKPVSYGFL